MLECPCTTRAIKSFEYELRATNDPGCTYNSSLTSAAECFAGAATAVKSNTLKNTTVADATKPSGCTVADDGATVFFNTASPPAPAAAAPSCASKSGKGGCVCRGMNGWIDHGRGKVRFEPNCLGLPKSELIATHNPTCDINQYDGGLQCCGGGFYLLDADQQIPEPFDEIYFKTRWYYEEYVPESKAAKPTYHLEWQFGHIEYSVPKAPPGTAIESAVHTLETHFTVRDFLVMGNQNAGGFGWDLSNTTAAKQVEFVMLGFHCHSPACLGGDLFNADTGQLICHVEPQAGNSTMAHYEENYLWLPPCQFGNPADGYQAPPVLSMDTNLTSIKTTNSSVAHSGVMAIWQGRGAWAN